MQALETQRLVPGQRLVETDLAQQYGVGRNAVREAVQWLAAHGVIDLTRHRSAAIRQLDAAETTDALDVAEPLVGLIVATAAQRYQAEEHRVVLEAALAELERGALADTPGAFSQARRHVYRVLIAIGGNSELSRLFRVLGLHIVYAQYRSPGLEQGRLADFQAMAASVMAGDAERGEAAGRAHVAAVRGIVSGS
jgi:DNA-binding GntR family transcriptional regulator